jgi:hypothetical protein
MKVREALAEQSHLHLSRVMHPDWAGVIKLKRKSLYLSFTPDLAWTAGQSFALRLPHRRVSRSSLVQEFRKAGEVNRWRAITLAGGQQQGVHLVRHNIATTIILHYTQGMARLRCTYLFLILDALWSVLVCLVCSNVDGERLFDDDGLQRYNTIKLLIITTLPVRNLV